ncbi:MAG: PDZ domain-containing protein [Clostridia bacterium]|nr:PDZ domain-containing protein [Clostridia bacterium]
MDRYDISEEPVQTKKRGPIRVSLGVLTVCILLTALIIFFATYIALSSYYGRFSELRKLQEIAALYEKNYLYDVDRETLSEELTKTYIYGCGDRFSSYYSAEEWAEQQASASGSSVGIGVYATLSESGDIYIARVMDGSPAGEAGLLSGDTVIAIDGTAVKEVGYPNAVNLIRGEIGSQVVLEILRGSETLTVTVTRAQYAPQTVYAETVLRDGELYGYVHIVEFLSVQTTYNQFKTAVDALIEAGVQGLIFDVRDNGGGDLNAILRILDYLLPKGPIVHMFYVGQTDPITYSSDANEIDLPMVVLANENTASAAELFTSALRDYEKAEIIGTKTFGKGCGQTGTMLSDGSVAFITTFLYNPPYSESYDGIGIFPDHEVVMAEEWQNKNLFIIPHEEDNQLTKAIDVIVSKAAGVQSGS